MNDMEITEITRGHLRVKHGDKSVTMYGEAFLRGHGSPDFRLYENTIKMWDEPDDQERVTLIEKEKIIQFLKEEFSRKKMLLEIV